MSTTRPKPLITGLAAAFVFALVVSALILLVPQGERQAFDQNTFHYRTIARFAAVGGLPLPSFADYESATTPGYHYLLAWVHRFSGGNLTTLRLTGALWGIALVGLMAGALARRGGSTLTGLALTLPLACSLYIVSASTGLLPDGAAWCLVAAMLILALRPRISISTLAAMGGVLLGLVLVRQIHLWAAALMVAAAWANTGGADVPSANRARLTHSALAGLFALPAALALAWFFNLWGGPVPPAFSAAGSPLTTHEYTRVSGLSPLTPGFVLALIGGLSVFYSGFLWPTLRRGNWLTHALIAAALGCIVAALPLSTWSLEAGRYSGLWNLVKRLPTFADRSPVIILAAGLGAASLVLWWKACAPRERIVLGAGLLAFTTAHSAQALVWQRYSEPLLLMLMSLTAAGITGRASGGANVPSADSPPRWACLGPLVLALANAAITAAAMMADKNPAPALGVVVP
ncbi:MAG: hypothetical protein ACKVS8_10235 [Phycisphaerales bacterium]